MKKLFFFCLGILIALCLVFSLANAGEKEDLQFKKIILQERLGRLQAEFELARRDLIDIQNRLSQIEAEEKVKNKSEIK